MLKLIIPLVILIGLGIYLYKYTTILASFRFSQATVPISQVAGATYYNIYYKSQDEQNFSNAVGKIPNVAKAYTINYLKKGVRYQFYETYIDKAGIEHQIAPAQWIQSPQAMN